MSQDFLSDFNGTLFVKHQQANQRFIKELYEGRKINQERYAQLLESNKRSEGVREIARQRISDGIEEIAFENSLKESKPIISKKNFLEILSIINSKADLGFIPEDILHNIIQNGDHYQNIVYQLERGDLLNFNLAFEDEEEGDPIDKLQQALDLIMDQSLSLLKIPGLLGGRQLNLSKGLNQFSSQSLKIPPEEFAYKLLKKREGESLDYEMQGEIAQKGILYGDLLEEIRDGENGHSIEKFHQAIAQSSHIPDTEKKKLLKLDIQVLINTLQEIDI